MIFRQKNTIFHVVFSLCIWETPKLILLQKNADPGEMLSGSTLFVKIKKDLQTTKYNIF